MKRPFSLLSIAHSYTVGLNRRIAHEIAEQSRGRWEVTVVAPEEMRGDLRPTRFQPIAGEPCKVEVVPVHWPERIHFMLYGRRLKQVLAQPWDLVHCWEEPYIAAGAQVAFHCGGRVPVVFYTFQNLNKRYPPPFSVIEKYCVRNSAGWIAAGQTVEEVLLQRNVGYEQHPHAVIPLGVDIERFRPDVAARAQLRNEFGWKESDVVIGFLGRLVPEKGLPMLMRVLDRLRLPWRALFIGAGPEQHALEQWIRSRPNDVRILTDVVHDKVPAYLNAFDLLCAPSQTTTHWREQFGRMLIEAFATGVPVIASDSGEIPHVVGDVGVIVGEKHEAGWEAAISAIVESPALRKELAAKGLERVHAKFAWPVIARQHLQFFEQLNGISEVSPDAQGQHAAKSLVPA